MDIYVLVISLRFPAQVLSLLHCVWHVLGEERARREWLAGPGIQCSRPGPGRWERAGGLQASPHEDPQSIFENKGCGINRAEECEEQKWPTSVPELLSYLYI